LAALLQVSESTGILNLKTTFGVNPYDAPAGFAVLHFPFTQTPNRDFKFS
jgi:hypothetical protein